MNFTADGILERLREDLKNEDSRIEGSFSMDNLQAVSEELARFYVMLVAPLQEKLEEREENIETSGNERHYVKWAKETVDRNGKFVVGNAKVSSPRDGSGKVHVAIISANANDPSEETITLTQNYIESKRPVGAVPLVTAAQKIEVVIDCTIKKSAGYTIETVKSTMKEALQEHFLKIAFQSEETQLNYHRVSSIINEVDGVLEILFLTINGEKKSMDAEYNKYFSFKELNLNAV